MKHDIKVISGFPGVGKTYCKQNSSLSILDSDSSKFSWMENRYIEKGIKNPNFPQNYIDHIKGCLKVNKADIIFVSSHKIVRCALVNNNINFILVFPERNLKKEYIRRFEDRDSDQEFIDMIDNNWDSFIDEMENQNGCEIVKLKFGEFLSDYLNKGVWKND